MTRRSCLSRNLKLEITNLNLVYMGRRKLEFTFYILKVRNHSYSLISPVFYHVYLHVCFNFL